MAPPKKYPQIAERIIREIKDGSYRVGREFPNLDEMSKMYQVSRVTAFKVLSHLVKEGYLSVGRGRKSVVISREKSLVPGQSVQEKNIALIADFTMAGCSEVTLKMVYAIQAELRNWGYHVICLQYCSNIDLRADDMDAYILFDILEVFSEYQALVKESGKPYVIVSCLKDHIRPNNLHVVFKTALWDLISHFMACRTDRYVFFVTGERSAYRRSSEEQIQKITEWLNGEIIRPLTGTLENHGISREMMNVYEMDTRPNALQKAIDEVTGKISPSTAIIVISENHAVKICQVLKECNLVPLRDFQFAFIDTVTGSPDEEIFGIHRVQLNLQDTVHKIVRSLEHQYSCKRNFAPGNIIHTNFIKP